MVVTPVIREHTIGGLCIGAVMRMNSGTAIITIYKFSSSGPRDS